jgi:hypothetical protein
MLKKLLVSAAIAGFVSSAALADHLVTVTWTGKVGSGADTLNNFGGGDLTGADFTTHYVFTMSPEFYQLGTATTGDDVYPFFGELYGAPVSASMTINGQTISWGGNYNSDLYAYDDPRQFFGTDNQSQFETAAEQWDGSDLDIITFNKIQEDGVDQPWANLGFADYDGDVSGALSDPNGNFFAMIHYSTLTYEQLFLVNQHLTIVNSEVAASSPTPEPASWAMMVGGFGLIGGAMRSRRRTAITFA